MKGSKSIIIAIIMEIAIEEPQTHTTLEDPLVIPAVSLDIPAICVMLIKIKENSVKEMKARQRNKVMGRAVGHVVE